MIKILCVGKIKEDFFTSGIKEYQKRIEGFSKFSIVEVKEVNTSDIPKNIEEELNDLLTNHKKQRQLLEDYEDLRCKLGNAGASNNAATIIVNDLNKKDK